MNIVAILLHVLLRLVFLLPGSMKPKRSHLPNIRKDTQPYVRHRWLRWPSGQRRHYHLA